MKQSAVDRFMSKVTIVGDAWLWTGSTSRLGYGSFRLDGRPVPAHRAAYQLFVGEIPQGMCVCHRDDHPSNVSPLNLFIGTHQDNMRDRDEKGRHGSIRLSAESVSDILYGEGTQREKAQRNGCSQPLVCYVMSRKGRYKKC